MMEIGTPHSVHDYFLGSDRCMFCNVCLCDLHHFMSDNLMFVGVIPSKPISENKAYLEGGDVFPSRPPSGALQPRPTTCSAF
jgi:hypothetical protein